MTNGYISSARWTTVIVMVLLAFSTLFTRLYYLHVYNQPELAKKVEKKRRKLVQIDSRRGDVVDSRGNLIATTRSSVTVGVDPQMVDLEDEVKLQELARIIKKPLHTFLPKLQKVAQKNNKGKFVYNSRWVKLVSGLDEDLYEQIKALSIKGVYGNRNFERTYPAGNFASHLIGFINREDTAVMGVERYMDYYLRGQDGWRETERDGRKRELYQYKTREVLPSEGLNVELTIDPGVQSAVESEVLKVVERYNPKGISVIVSQPSTGYILGLANYPSFDPNSFGKATQDSLRNRALTDIYEPGSTFKIVATSAALEERLVDPKTLIDCGVSQVEYRGRVLRLPKDDHDLEAIAVTEVVAQSSNRGAAQLGMMLGEDRLYNYSKMFGFGRKTDLGFRGEVNGILHPVKKWDGLTITRLPMGHAISATPMQVHSAMASIASGGILMKPSVVRKVFTRNNDTVVQFDPVAIRRIVTKQTSRMVTGMLTKVVSDEGTARRAAIEGYAVAGKTGTTKKIVDGLYSNRHHVGSFSGFFPASNPQVVITVVVDEPRFEGIGYGGVVAAPAFRRIAEEIIRYMDIEPEYVRRGLASSDAPYGSNNLY